MNAIAEAKQRLPLAKLMADRGIKLPCKNRFNIPCPIHGEQKGNSFSVTVKGGGQQVWKCHGKCQCGGDEITFLEKFENLSRKDAVKRYLELAGVQTAKKSKRKSKSAIFIELDWHPLSPDKDKPKRKQNL